MVSPRPSRRESPARKSRARVVLLGVVGVLVALAVCMATARLTATGFLGFGVTLSLVLMVGAGVIGLREVRRVGRAVRRIEGQLQRVRQDSTDTRSRLNGLERRAAAAGASLEATRSAARDLVRGEAGHRRSLDTLIANQLETNRSVSAGLRPEAMQAMLATQLRQQQAMLNLFAVAPVRDIVPTMGGWAASADVVAVLVAELLRIRPRLVLECGSGVSTLWLALAIEQHGLDCRIVSLDHDPHFAEQTRRSLRAHGVGRHVEVRDAALTPTELPGHSTPWYDRSALHGLEGLGLVFVDGPPDDTGPLVRYPAVPLLSPFLASTATIVLDDLIRPGEKEVVARWRLQLPDFDLQQLPLQKSAAVFRRAAPNPDLG